jgi:uncharacterized spore protein YtfJ
MQLQETFLSIVNQATVKTIFGEPISAEGKTIVPVAAIRYGFGGGSGHSEKDDQEGGGGGGGFIGKPLGVVEITRQQTRFIPIRSDWTILAAFGIGVALGFLTAPKRVDVRVEKSRRD